MKAEPPAGSCSRPSPRRRPQRGGRSLPPLREGVLLPRLQRRHRGPRRAPRGLAPGRRGHLHGVGLGLRAPQRRQRRGVGRGHGRRAALALVAEVRRLAAHGVPEGRQRDLPRGAERRVQGRGRRRPGRVALAGPGRGRRGPGAGAARLQLGQRQGLRRRRRRRHGLQRRLGRDRASGRGWQAASAHGADRLQARNGALHHALEVHAPGELCVSILHACRHVLVDELARP
mmetsp:Transcript_96045/g.310121  ORF Transcript_96045/g.310121 Transcript_96045/m.310121 type:complete len:230 (+) Transcript_96045:6-695(+)